MRRWASAAVLSIAIFVAAGRTACAQVAPSGGAAPAATGGAGIGLGAGLAIGAVGAAAVAPMIASAVLGRELTISEVWHLELGLFLGPPGWWLADRLFPSGDGRGPRRLAPHGQRRRGGNVEVPPAGVADFVPNEVLVEFRAGSSPDAMLAALQLTQLEQQTFVLIGRTVARLRIDSGRSVGATLLAMRRYTAVAAAQPNHVFVAVQEQSEAQALTAQYVVAKMHLREAHRVTNGDDVPVAIIDSQIDGAHPDLAGIVSMNYDALGGEARPHTHGTAMAGAIAARGKLVGVAPKIRLLAIRAFAGESAAARGTTFNVLKGIDWAAAQNARILNMSFAGPADSLLADMLGKAYARGMILVAAVGNSGPRSPPLYPAAYHEVIGVTATDADDKVLAIANRGRQVAVAAPGVDVIEPAPNRAYQVTSGTSVAAAHVSGVAALLLARDPKLTPAALRRALVRAAHEVPASRRDVGAGVIDALAAVQEFGKH